MSDAPTESAGSTVSKVHESRAITSTYLLKKLVTNAVLATSAAAVVDVIRQTLEAPSIYVFGELLEVDNVKALHGTAEEPYLALLNLFAFGTYADYLKQKQDQPSVLPDLSPAMLYKLRQLTIVSLSRSRRNIPYQELLHELGISDIRILEDLIIDMIYSNVIQGSIDQQNSRLEVDQTIGRDVRLDQDFDTINSVLGEWCRNCDSILTNLEHQMSAANRYKEEANTAKAMFESKIALLKKNLKTANETANEDIVMTDLGFGREQERVEKMKRNFNPNKLTRGINYRALSNNKNWRKDT